MHLTRMKIILGIGGAILVVGVIFFREPIGSLLNFGVRDRDVNGSRDSGEGFITPPVVDNESSDPRSSGSGTQASLPQSEESPTGPFPAYQGRDPAEIRPDLKTIAGLSEEQRREAYRQIEIFARTIKDQPTFGQAWLQIGLLKKSIGDYEGARDAWAYAAIVRPESFVPPANLAQIYWHYLPDHPEAERQFREAIRRDPNQQSLYIGLADLYSFAYREKEPFADDVLREGLEAIPGQPDILKALGALYERRGEYRTALEWWEKVREADPSNADVQAKIQEIRSQL